MSNRLESLPRLLRDYVAGLPPGTYTPFPYPSEVAPTNSDFVAFVGNTDDELVREIDSDPKAEIRLGVYFHPREENPNAQIVLIWPFLSIEGLSGTKHVFEMGFNVGDPDMRQHLRTLSQQTCYDILSGD